MFAPELPGLDRARIRSWYDGYNWLGKENVYNPYDVLLLFRQREFEAHWFETGTPAFLVHTLRERRVSSLDLEAMTGDRSLLSKFDVGDVGTEALLFQSGYLTIKGVERDAGGRARYRLGYPNQEVRQSLNESLLDALVPNASAQLSSGARFRELLGTNDFDGLRDLIQAHFDGIPHQWHVRNDIADYEGYYASVFYSCLAAPRVRRGGRGQQRPRARGPDAALRRRGVHLRVQGDGAGGRRLGAVAVEGQGLRGQGPRPRRAHPPRRHRVQPRDADPRGVRGGVCVT